MVETWIEFVGAEDEEIDKFRILTIVGFDIMKAVNTKIENNWKMIISIENCQNK